MKFLLILLILVSVTACDEGLQGPPAPKDLIEREDMIDLMTEMVKLECLVEYRMPGVNRFHSSMIQSADSLFKAHKVSAEQYDRSMEYYGAHQADLQEMYDEVLERLGKELGELESK